MREGGINVASGGAVSGRGAVAESDRWSLMPMEIEKVLGGEEVEGKRAANESDAAFFHQNTVESVAQFDLGICYAHACARSVNRLLKTVGAHRFLVGYNSNDDLAHTKFYLRLVEYFVCIVKQQNDGDYDGASTDKVLQYFKDNADENFFPTNLKEALKLNKYTIPQGTSNLDEELRQAVLSPRPREPVCSFFLGDDQYAEFQDVVKRNVVIEDTDIQSKVRVFKKKIPNSVVVLRLYFLLVCPLITPVTNELLLQLNVVPLFF